MQSPCCVRAMGDRQALAPFGDATEAMGDGKSGSVETGLTRPVATALRFCWCGHTSDMVFETYLVLDYSLFPFLHTTLNWSLEITDLVTMATNTWTSHTNHGIMDILSCHVCKGIHHHTNQNEAPSGKYRNAIQYVSPNCHYNLSHISQSHGSPKTILISPEEKDPNKIWKKINQN